MVTSICGSSSRGVIKAAIMPSTRPKMANSGVNCERSPQAANLPAIPNGLLLITNDLAGFETTDYFNHVVAYRTNTDRAPTVILHSHQGQFALHLNGLTWNLQPLLLTHFHLYWLPLPRHKITIRWQYQTHAHRARLTMDGWEYLDQFGLNAVHLGPLKVVCSLGITRWQVDMNA